MWDVGMYLYANQAVPWAKFERRGIMAKINNESPVG
jgi:hypothetical protein